MLTAGTGRDLVIMLSGNKYLVKIQEMGKKIYLFVLSGTEVVETLLSQFSNRELYGKTLTNPVGFPAPMYHREPQTRRDKGKLKVFNNKWSGNC